MCMHVFMAGAQGDFTCAAVWLQLQVCVVLYSRDVRVCSFQGKCNKKLIGYCCELFLLRDRIVWRICARVFFYLFVLQDSDAECQVAMCSCVLV